MSGVCHGETNNYYSVGERRGRSLNAPLCFLVMLCSELFLRSNQVIFFPQLRVSLRNYFAHGPLLAVFLSDGIFMNVSHYVAVVH